MQETTKHPKWHAFVSLAWYDGLISFLFRFVSKTAEPLLAAGVIVSAADFLQKGQLMSNNPMLANAWTWTQALAIEASTGPVLVFALQAFRSRDMVQGWLYAALAALLFVVGGAMLLLQLMSNANGLSEASINGVVLLILFALRVIVSAGMIALSCTKHMTFSGLLKETPVQTVQAVPQVITPSFDEILDKLDARYEQRMQAILEHTVETVRLTITEQTNPNLPALALVPAPARDELAEHAQSLMGSQFVSKEQAVARVLSEHPDATIEQIMVEAPCSRRTAEKWMSKHDQR